MMRSRPHTWRCGIAALFSGGKGLHQSGRLEQLCLCRRSAPPRAPWTPPQRSGGAAARPALRQSQSIHHHPPPDSPAASPRRGAGRAGAAARGAPSPLLALVLAALPSPGGGARGGGAPALPPTSRPPATACDAHGCARRRRRRRLWHEPNPFCMSVGNPLPYRFLPLRRGGAGRARRAQRAGWRGAQRHRLRRRDRPVPALLAFDDTVFSTRRQVPRAASPSTTVFLGAIASGAPRPSADARARHLP